MNVLRKKPEKWPGLPARVLFQHLERPPRGKVTIEFLKENVWWWRIPDVPLQVWLADIAVGWPDCELYKLFESWQPNSMPRSSEEAQDRARVMFDHIEADPQLHRRLCKLWDCEFDAGKGYEWEAREKGAYPLGEPYCVLTSEQRNKWRLKYFQLNLNAIPAVWVKDVSPVYDFDTEKLTSDFQFSLCAGAVFVVRFNLRHGDGWLNREFKQTVIQERTRRGICISNELRPDDGAMMRSFKKFVSRERIRLSMPSPKNEGANRRSLFNRSWADIENIDIKTHSKEKTASRTRQRESVAHQKWTSRTERKRQIAGWKLTVLKRTSPRG